jgi:putative tributyrin esterase
MRRIFGPAPAGGTNDPYALAEQIDRQFLPALRIDCGLEDGLLEENRAFHRHLEQLAIPHEYEEFPGAHT